MMKYFGRTVEWFWGISRIQRKHLKPLLQTVLTRLTKENPVDDCSQGLEMKHNKNVKRWFQGPEFLWRPQTAWCEERLLYDIAEDDVEVKMTMRVNAISKEDDILSVGIQNIFLEES